MSTAAMLLACALLAQPPASGDALVARKADPDRRQLLELYNGEAAGYVIHRDASRQEKLELRREPVYIWNNRVRSGGQYGAVYVWTYRGRAEAIGSFFTSRINDNRDMCHEFHSLSPTALDVSRTSGGRSQWTPRTAGIRLELIPGAPAPAGSASQRLAQMRALAREYSATTRDQNKAEWELRLLPQPLYRYESTDPEVVDGADFTFVTSAGTDPEAILVVEARKPAAGGDPAWHYAAGRFTDMDLWVRHKGTVVYTAERIAFGTPEPDGNHRYDAFQDRRLPPFDGSRP